MGKPRFEWSEFTSLRPGRRELETWLAMHVGIGMVVGRVENDAPVKVQAEFSQSGYDQALKAVTNGPIRLTGWLRQESSRWVLEADGMPTLLEVATSSDDVTDADVL